MFQYRSAHRRVIKSKVRVAISRAALKFCTIRIAATVALAPGLIAVTTVLAGEPCCGVVDIAANGQVTAREINGTRTITFQVRDAALLRRLKPGAPVYANFGTKQVSLDGKKACCVITQMSAVATPAAVKSTPPEPAPATSALSPSSVGGGARISLAVPLLSFGAPQNVTTPNWRDGPQRLLQYQNDKALQLRGLDGIKAASAVPQAAKDMLWLHARGLEAQDLDAYIVNPELAQEWSRTVPDSVREKLHKAATDDGKKKKKGCSTKHISTGCLQNEVDQAVDDMTKAARKAWKDIEDEWGRFMEHAGDAQECFMEKTLSARIPLKFSVAPQIPVSFEKDGKAGSKSGGASGKVTGTVTVGLPVQVDSVAQLNAFYIPCMPFAIRPKSIGADGKIDVEGIINSSVTASGEFDYLFTMPPAGGIQIPLVVIPIVLAGVPIAVLDASVYLDGTLQVDGKGTINGNLKLQSLQKSDFKFECSGHNCGLDSRGTPAPATAVESVKLDGRIHIKPAIYAALQLGLNYNLLNVRAGPQPYLLGEVYGCGSATAAQSTTGSSDGQQLYALTADLDWGVELRAEALAGGKKMAATKIPMQQQHIYFKDLANSTALMPSIAGTAQPSVAQTAVFTMKMPTCYPYSDSMQYRVGWTGGASAPTSAGTTRKTSALATGSAPVACTPLQAGQASCNGAPLGNTALNLVWQQPGNYSLTVTPFEDKHGRKFSASSATQMNLSVQP